MICDNEMCFDLTEKHPEEKKNAISRSSHQTASTLLFICLFLAILCASKLGHAICTNFSSFKKKKKQLL